PPRAHPTAACAAAGTHDTEPMAVWWEQAPLRERRAVLETPSVQSRLSEEERTRALTSSSLSSTVRLALLEVLYASGANLLVLPIQDEFGWSDRINQPATVSDQNWTWRLPWPSDRISREPEAVAVAQQLRTWSANYTRCGANVLLRDLSADFRPRVMERDRPVEDRRAVPRVWVNAEVSLTLELK